MDRQRLILEKNRAFDVLSKADRHIDRRRNSHRHGNAAPVPDAWLERREELAERYRAALESARG